MIVIYCLLGAAVLSAALYLFATATNRRRSTAPFDRLPIAHRGLHTEDGEAPENSLAAFARARDAGVAVELDVQLTADRQVVVFHDDTLTRMCGVDKPLDQFTYTELSTLSLQGGQEHIPLLSDVLEVLGDTPLVCEIKSYGPNTDTSLCALAWPILATHQGPLCVESFNPIMLRWFKKHQPQVIRGVLSTNFDDVENLPAWLGFILRTLMANFLTRPDFIAYDYVWRNNLSFRVCRKLFRPTTIAWTITDSEQQADALKTFDSCIFEQYHPHFKEEQS